MDQATIPRCARDDCRGEKRRQRNERTDLKVGHYRGLLAVASLQAGSGVFHGAIQVEGCVECFIQSMVWEPVNGNS